MNENKSCDHCGRENINDAKEIKIQIGGYTDTANLCPACVGKLMHINEAFLNGEEFVRDEGRMNESSINQHSAEVV